MAYFCWADVVKLWQDLMMIKQCDLTLGKKKKFPQPKQHAAGYAPPPTRHTSALSSHSVRNSSATLRHNNKQHRDNSDWWIQLVLCCRSSMGGWCLMSCCETSKTASKSCLRVCRHGSSGERPARWNCKLQILETSDCPKELHMCHQTVGKTAKPLSWTVTNITDKIKPPNLELWIFIGSKVT